MTFRKVAYFKELSWAIQYVYRQTAVDCISDGIRDYTVISRIILRDPIYFYAPDFDHDEKNVQECKGFTVYKRES